MSLLNPELRTPNPDCPWALIWKEEFGILRVIRAHVANLPWLTRDHGWQVLITDLDVPITLGPGQEWAKVRRSPKGFYPPDGWADGSEEYR